MRVTVRNSYESSPNASPDVAVFFDVFRASTTLLSLVHVGASTILSANDEETCRAYLGRGYELISEVFRGGIDNSPTQVLAGGYGGRPVIHKSTNLTTAVFNNRRCKRALVGGFGNASTLVEYLKASGAETVELVAAAHFGRRSEAVEDLACAETIRRMLEGTFDGRIARLDEVTEKIRQKSQRQPPVAAHYLADIRLAIELDRFPYLIEAKPLNDRLMEIVKL